jgi:hypothetical protein
MQNEIEKAIESCQARLSSYKFRYNNSTETSNLKLTKQINLKETKILTLEKQKPKEAKENAVQGNCYGCPDCESLIVPCQKYCVNCGQALLWLHTNV